MLSTLSENKDLEILITKFNDRKMLWEIMEDYKENS